MYVALGVFVVAVVSAEEGYFRQNNKRRYIANANSKAKRNGIEISNN